MAHSVRRVHYFVGQLLTPEDLQAEQDYHRELRYLHNRLLGHGVVNGLEVSVGDDGTLVVGAGLAIDTAGRELVLTRDVAVDLAGCGAGDAGWWAVVATWHQQPDRFLPPVDGATQDPAFARWLERPRITLARPGEAPAGSIVLGRVRIRNSGASTIDDGGRNRWQRAAG